MKKQIGLKLEEEEIAILEKLGGKSKGVHKLISDYRDTILGKKVKKTVEEIFYDSLILPSDPRLRETYKAFLEAFIRSGARMGSLDFWEPELTGTTGFNGKAVRGHFRKLSASRYVKSFGFLFRPSLRLKEGVEKEKFFDIHERFHDFLLEKGAYQDFGEFLWDNEDEK